MTEIVTVNDVLHVVEHQVICLEKTVDEDQQSAKPNGEKSTKQVAELSASV
jgi:hypothetical protein